MACTASRPLKRAISSAVGVAGGVIGQGAGLRVELQARKLSVEGIDVGGRRTVAFAGLGLVAQGLVGAAQPVVGARPAQGTVG